MSGVFLITRRLKDRGVTMLLENGRISVHGPAGKLRHNPAVKAAYLGGSHQASPDRRRVTESRRPWRAGAAPERGPSS